MLSLLATPAFAATGRFLLKSLVSLILSAMIVWDLPSLARGMQSLQTSRFAPIYDELAPVVLTFGRIFCRALEAQSLIAVVNTALTFLGMMLLNIHGLLVLSAVVFVFSFVPVAGVVISTVPMGLVALSEGGVVKVVLVVLMVVLMHALEAYILNPAIYSAHLKLHPILTLAVLLIAEHAMGVWGLLVAVPLTKAQQTIQLRLTTCQQLESAAQHLEVNAYGTVCFPMFSAQQLPGPAESIHSIAMCVA
ncbi:unnamed protein product [Closterium sp. Yama58-4]|nr:unnamed protein product [Closterium sp. Yama58-4]